MSTGGAPDAVGAQKLKRTAPVRNRAREVQRIRGAILMRLSDLTLIN